MSDTPATTLYELNLFQRYFDLVASGRKTIEVRVKYPKLEGLEAGDLIRFRVKDTDQACLVRVLRVAEYASFADLLDGEGPARVNPASTREEQLTNIRAIYGLEKESLGALAIEIQLTAPDA
ncbi:ASCH domain-containing protein [Streptomyces sp. NBC_00162]|uniref:ASCH domain-containing protein n=1 Tax=Streptomyces sp. NBC_00162 TaxID=2903629 RepID=UPI00214BE234|nr:ASCH domain-containing protein [Streptomyces sp. NBC_00162]UUU38447.1 ASCH domain-containing protein [Streptomyces sp. NBC_00162]